MRRLVNIGLLLAAAGCGGSSETAGNKSATTAPTGTFKVDGGPAPANAGGCADAARLVYVVSDKDDLYSFQPDATKFTKVGRLNCQAGAATPNSMAIDRAGVAWVNYSDGSLFRVSTRDASCSSTPFAPGQNGFTRFGMAFASNKAGSDDETLFVVGLESGGKGRGLATIDLGTFKLTPIGDFSAPLTSLGAELTGTGEGKLFGFFTTKPNATLAQIDKRVAATTDNVALPGVDTGNAWAFSFWGGDFWFYTSSSELEASKLTRLRASSDNALDVVVNDVGGFRIVGAGVSTCAPTAPTR